MRSDVSEAVVAPEFPADREWLNTTQPLRLADLRGQVVLLHFWTYGCVQCQHALAELARLQASHPVGLAVIGVHSARFPHECDPEAVRQAVLRCEVDQPVCLDSDLLVWSAYGIQSRPTLVWIDATGHVAEVRTGEVTAAQLEPRLQALLRQASAAPRAMPTGSRERDRQPATLLRFPGAVLADAAGDGLVIADSGHHRYVLTDLTGEVREVIGSGVAGFRDGSFAEAQFRHPHGATRLGDRLYLADTGNHALRVADLRRRTVTTLVGNGARPARPNQSGTGPAVQLASPWDVAQHAGQLLVANAGSHQLWTVDPTTAEARPLAGSARRDLVDGPAFLPLAGALGADATHGAALAQPSGLAVGDGRLYFVDAETSALRCLDLTAPAAVRTLVGQGLNQYGDEDGPAGAARLQHCLGVAWQDGRLYVADGYNHKVRQWDLDRGELRPCAGTGDAGDDDGDAAEAAFDEPGGVSAVPGALFVADTNNHAIRRVDLATGLVSTLQWRHPERAAPPAPELPIWVELPPVSVDLGAVDLVVTVAPLPGFELCPEASITLCVTAAPTSARPESVEVTAVDGQARWPLPLGATGVWVEARAYLRADTGSGACLVVDGAWHVPLARVRAGTDTLALTLHQPA